MKLIRFYVWALYRAHASQMTKLQDRLQGCGYVDLKLTEQSAFKPPLLESLLFFMKLSYQFLVALLEVEIRPSLFMIKLLDHFYCATFCCKKLFKMVKKQDCSNCGLIWVETLTINWNFLTNWRVRRVDWKHLEPTTSIVYYSWKWPRHCTRLIWGRKARQTFET